MIRHIVMWRFADKAFGKTKEENMAHVREALLALRGVVPGMTRMEIGCDISHTDMSYDMVLITEFEDAAALEGYRVFPSHKEVQAYVKQVRTARVTVDCEI